MKPIALTAADRLFFLHIPKTGGISFRTLLENHFPQAEVCPAQMPEELQAIPSADLAKYRLFRGHFAYSLHELLPIMPLYLTFLRNPIERTISHFRHVQREEVSPIHIYVHKFNMDIRDFVAAGLTAEESKNIQTRFIASTAMNWEAIKFFQDYGGVELAQTRLKDFAVVGLTERFAESMHLLAYTFGWRPITQFQALNTAPQKSRRTEFRPDEIEAVAQVNAEDMALYEYAEMLFSERYQAMCADLASRYDVTQYLDNDGFLPANSILDCLEQRYITQFREQNNPQVSAIQIVMTEPLVGENWYPPEKDERVGWVRWTGPGIRSSFDVALDSSQSWQIRVRLIFALDRESLRQFKIFANGQQLETTHTRDEIKAWIYTAIIPAELLQNSLPFVRIDFEGINTVAPASLDANNLDQRQLGIMVNRIEFESR